MAYFCSILGCFLETQRITLVWYSGLGLNSRHTDSVFWLWLEFWTSRWLSTIRILTSQVFGFPLCFPSNCNYSGHLKSRLAWISNDWKEIWFQLVWISNLIYNPEAQQFEIWINGCNFVKNHLKSGPKHMDPMVWFSNSWDYNYSRR